MGQENNTLQFTRRQFVKSSTAVSGGLLLGLNLTACSTTHNKLHDDGSWQANAWLEISPDNTVTFTLARVEMGQGTYTGITTLVAEELNLDPELIHVEFAGAAQVYRNPGYGLQITGGSNSLATSWLPIRSAAASAREMLLAAAAQVLNVPSAQLVVAEGRVSDASSGQSLSFGELAALAAKQSVPDEPALKAKSEFKYIGKQNKRLDSLAKVQGKANFGIDASVEGMRCAVVLRPPAIGGKLVSHDGDRLIGENGVEALAEIGSGLAIIAKSYWQARSAVDKINASWDLPDMLPSTEAAFALYRKVIEQDDAETVRSEGDASDGFELASTVVEVEFELPFLAHATMEPMNCTAHVQEDRADIWVSTQGPDLAQVVVAKVSHLGLDDVYIHNQFIGGGFGRRLNQDFIGEAAEISVAVKGPIKLVWSREDDMRNDFYRPASLHRLKGGLDESGNVSAWQHHVVAPGVMDWYVWDAAPAMFPAAPKFMYPMLGKVGLATAGTPMTPADRSAYEGADDLEYGFANSEVLYSKADIGVPAGFWRAVGHSHNGFVTEGFIDILAEKSGKDALQFRLELLKDSPRMQGVLKRAAKEGKWSEPSRAGTYKGIAAHKSFGSYVAELVELRVENNEIKVEKVVCVIDCGLVVNPDIVRMQMESCIIFGLTAALYGEINIENGQARQSNFHDYQMVRMSQCPEIETYIIESEESPTGVGEPGLPPLAPAMASALYNALGKRFTSLPFKLV
jgi:isoquinoline 1-oxidoreductase subunit beta